MKDFINVGLLGAGTVGGGVIHVLERNAADIAKKVGMPIKITKIFGREAAQLAAVYGDGYYYTTNADEILEDPEIDIVVELIGREHPAKEFIAKAFENGKSVVTANKDVLAKYGAELFPLAEAAQRDFMFEASVAGGIPILQTMKTSLAANKISSVMGIVNGTTNYMLTKMSQEHMDYDDVLKEAQAMGYAESDPTADVGGLDAARKAVILASIAFNTRVSLDDVQIEGIQNVGIQDIEYAEKLGYVIKLLAIAKNDPENGISVCVRPTMLPKSHPLASVNDVFNAIFVTGDALGEAMFMGRGAGRRSRGGRPQLSEKDRLIQKYNQLEQDIVTYENNIGFFSMSKNSEPLINQMNERIAQAKEELKSLAEQIRVLDEAEEQE